MCQRKGIQVGNNSFSGSSHCPGSLRRTFRLISRAGRILLPVFLSHEITLPILKPATIKMMTASAPAYPPGDARYARGWMVRNDGAGNWWHNGSLPGTTSIVVRIC
jgi:hypothetical protein